MPQVPEDAHGEAVTPLRRLSKSLFGEVWRATALQNEIVSPGFAGRAGSLRPAAQTFLTLLAKKAGADELFDTLRAVPPQRGDSPVLLVFPLCARGKTP